MKKEIKICDCTLRDGGYYTNWDFEKSLVDLYFHAMNDIPAITHLEIGYRSLASDAYYGEYFYCPESVMQNAKELCPDKTIAIMLNEKDTRLEDLDALLNPCKPYIGLIRIAVDPKNLERAAILAKAIKAKGFQMGFNIMYMSQWATDEAFIDKLNVLEEDVDYIYMVDSFGGIYSDDVKKALNSIKKRITIPVGFHGHNNIELGLANSLSAIENGCDIIDATITGMGRGAGNLKTELLLTVLNAQNIIHLNFNKLNAVINRFEEMHKQYEWGTNLPYMISGAYSLPQKDVMSWFLKRRYTTESIINALQNKKDQKNDNYHLPVFKPEAKFLTAIIIGGGQNTLKHANALQAYCEQNNDIIIIHAGVRYVSLFNKLSNKKYYCLLGSEGNKLKPYISELNLETVSCIIEPAPRIMGTILPEEIINKTYELSKVTFMKNYPDNLLTIAFQVCIELKVDNTILFGFDGYDLKTNDEMIEVFYENQLLIDAYVTNVQNLQSFLPTNYKNVSIKSVYSII